MDTNKALELVRREREKRLDTGTTPVESSLASLPGAKFNDRRPRSLAAPVVPRQRAFLRQRCLPVPPTRALAHRLIAFVLSGNGTGGATEIDRVNIVRSYHGDWYGKRVVVLAGGKPKAGKVEALSFYLLSEVDAELRGRYEGAFFPMALLIRWDGGEKTGLVPVSEIRRFA